jgi:endonuclease YncB( thermonuclease family)
VRRHLLALASAALLVAAAAPPPEGLAPPPERLPAAGGGLVLAVEDGDTLDMDDGRVVRLAGIEAPKPPVGRNEPGGHNEGRHWPLAEAARAALGELALGRRIELRGAGTADRHGRILAHVVRDDGVWLQGALLTRGLARVHTRPDARDLATDMLALETGARGAGRGLWRTRAFAVRPAEPPALERDIDSFQIVEGRVVSAAKVHGQVFLNFGADWRDDVTVRISPEALKVFTRAGVDPMGLEGRAVRVRGWVGLRNGPMIEATHPEQIEAVDGAALPHPPPRRTAARHVDEDADGEDRP